MPRQARRKSRSGVYHVMLRGINKQTMFEEDEDRRRFLGILFKYRKKGKFQLFGYCLMDNHVHLLLKETGEPVSESIKRISSSYVYWYNMKYDRCGHLFQERFKSEPVETSGSFLRVLRYIHQNPLKAGLAKSVVTSKWTSIDEYTKKDSDVIDILLPLQLFSTDRRKSVDRYIEFMEKSNDDYFLDDYPKVCRTDAEVKEYMGTLCITNISMLQKLDRQKRNNLLKKLKQLDGVTVRQLSRVTGISKSVIDRLR